MNQIDDFTYVVKLAPGKTSFYDPVSQCNLFLSRSVFGFNIEPTTNILKALKAGTLVDIKGNLKVTDTIRPSLNRTQLRNQDQPLPPLPQNQNADKEASKTEAPKVGGNKGGNKNSKGNNSSDNLPPLPSAPPVNAGE